jgi:hypothetical protein
VPDEEGTGCVSKAVVNPSGAVKENKGTKRGDPGDQGMNAITILGKGLNQFEEGDMVGQSERWAGAGQAGSLDGFGCSEQDLFVLGKAPEAGGRLIKCLPALSYLLSEAFAFSYVFRYSWASRATGGLFDEESEVNRPVIREIGLGLALGAKGKFERLV